MTIKAHRQRTNKQVKQTLIALAVSAALSPAAALTAHATVSDATGSYPVTSGPSPASQSLQKHKDAVASQNSNRLESRHLRTIVVTGIRESLQNAELIKKNSAMIEDSIVAENIGKLPDNSVAQALQRIPGVQIAPNTLGETGTVLVRGLPDIVTTLNGRNFFSGSHRRFTFNQMPATAVKAINVYKTSSAALPAGGIAGVINMQLYRPFDFKGAKIAGTVTGVHRKYGGHYDPVASLLLSDQWNTSIGKIGALVNAGYIGQHFNNQVVLAGVPTLLKNNKTHQPIRTSSGNLIDAPIGFQALYTVGNHKREEFNYALQWAPNVHTQVYLEGIYTKSQNDYGVYALASYQFHAPGEVNLSSLHVSNDCFADQLAGPYQGQTICNASSASWTSPVGSHTGTNAEEDDGHNLQNTLGVKWSYGSLRLKSSLAFTQSSQHSQSWVVNTHFPNKPPVTLVWPGYSGGRPNFYLAGNPGNVPTDSKFGLFKQSWQNNHGKEVEWKIDGTYWLSHGIVKKLQFGFKLANHRARSSGSVQHGHLPPKGSDINVADFSSAAFCQLPATSAQPQPFISICRGSIANNIGAFRQYYGTPAAGPGVDPTRFFNIDEKRYVGYFQAAYGTRVLGFKVDGLLGIRALKVNRNLKAFSYDSATNVYSPLSVDTNQTNYLPNFSAVIHLTPDLQARLIAAKTLTYPAFAQLNPALTLNPALIIDARAFASSGNPYLKPTKSDNYDASLEWYFARDGYVSADAFYRNINGYIQTYQTPVTINNAPYTLTAPQSAGHGHLNGASVAYQQFFRWLPGFFGGFGMQFNYTYINGSTVSPQTIGGPSVITPLENVSKNNFNAVLIYQKYGAYARLAYTFRSNYLPFFGPPTVVGNYINLIPSNALDLDMGYNITPHFTVDFGATNLLGAVSDLYWGKGTALPRNIQYTDRAYRLGFRFNF